MAQTVEQRVEEERASAGPAYECDLVMRGGITSGVVYPPAIAKLARTYRLRNIGGTSAGAIAAAAAAAAEYRRQAGGGAAGFDALGDVSCDLSREGRFRELFRPQRETQGLFRLFLAALRPGGTIRRFFRIAIALMRLTGAWTLTPLIGFLIGGVLLTWLVGDTDLAPVHAYLIAGVVGVFVAAVLAAGVLVDAVGRGAKALRRNRFGLTRGFDGHDGCLTAWVHQTLQDIAGRGDGAPLTFGDLWEAGRKDGSDAPSIDLRMVTTNLTLGLPHTLPYLPGRWEDLAFRSDELGSYFPPDVVAALKVRGRIEGTDLWRWPEPAALPIVVAVRLSLSFPLLISAVPLFADRNARAEAEGRDDRSPSWERVWFSDGGITSNFPIHFFDTALPTRPTFGINLRRPDREHPIDPVDQDKNVFMVGKVTDDAPESWHRIDKSRDISKVTQFAGLLLNAVQNWNDTARMSMNGLQDRVVHIYQGDREGGLNLEMDPDVVKQLLRRGEAAADRILRVFPDTHPTDLEGHWNRHRWARLRGAGDSFEGYLLETSAKYRKGAYGELLDAVVRNPDVDLPYGLTAEQWAYVARLRAVPGEVADLQRPAEGLAGDVPEPRAPLRQTPAF